MQAIHEGINNFGGKLSWSDCVAPVRDLARDGFVVSSFLEDITRKQWSKILKNDALTKVLSRPSSDPNSTPTPIRQGDILKRPQLANTLTMIMEVRRSDV